MHGTTSWYRLIDLSNLNKLVVGPYFKIFYFIYVTFMFIKKNMYLETSCLSKLGCSLQRVHFHRMHPKRIGYNMVVPWIDLSLQWMTSIKPKIYNIHQMFDHMDVLNIKRCAFGSMTS